jgi:hypothetical protein
MKPFDLSGLGLMVVSRASIHSLWKIHHITAASCSSSSVLLYAFMHACMQRGVDMRRYD